MKVDDVPCVLFASGHDMGQFVSKKFDNWSRKTRKFAQHNKRVYHKVALVRMEALKSSITHTIYRRSIVLPLLDGFIQQMKERFSKTQVTVARLLDLVPSVLCTHSSISFEEVTSFYEDDLPSAALMSTEVWRWIRRAKWLTCDAESRPTTLLKALKACDKDYFPNIHVLLRIACTIPVTSCENERANSSLKNLKSYLRSTMGQERLSYLALMNIHYEKNVNFNSVIDKFKLKGNRRIQL